MTQKPTIRCDRCGLIVLVTKETPYEFGYRCRCGEAGVISWYHGAEPPTFQARLEPEPQQQELF